MSEGSTDLYLNMSKLDKKLFNEFCISGPTNLHINTYNFSKNYISATFHLANLTHLIHILIDVQPSDKLPLLLSKMQFVQNSSLRYSLEDE